MGKKEPRPTFLSRPPACLEPSVVKVSSSGAGNEQAMTVEARDLQNRLRDQVTQLLGENSTFQRLMYKSCNQHRRATYFRRLAQIRRDFQLLQLFRLPELIETFIQFVAPEKDTIATAKTGSLFSGSWGAEAKHCDRISVLRQLLGTARLLQQMAEPILDASLQITGLLSQSFFMPFALTMLASLARFRVLVLQVLYEVIAAFNLVAATSQCRQESGSTLFRPEQKGMLPGGEEGHISKETSSLPLWLECQWDGVKLLLFEKEPPPPLLPPPLPLPSAPPLLSTEGFHLSSTEWFVDDRSTSSREKGLSSGIAENPVLYVCDEKMVLGTLDDEHLSIEYNVMADDGPLLSLALSPVESPQSSELVIESGSKILGLEFDDRAGRQQAATFEKDTTHPQRLGGDERNSGSWGSNQTQTVAYISVVHVLYKSGNQSLGRAEGVPRMYQQENVDEGESSGDLSKGVETTQQPLTDLKTSIGSGPNDVKVCSKLEETDTYMESEGGRKSSAPESDLPIGNGAVGTHDSVSMTLESGILTEGIWSVDCDRTVHSQTLGSDDLSNTPALCLDVPCGEALESNLPKSTQPPECDASASAQDLEVASTQALESGAPLTTQSGGVDDGISIQAPTSEVSLCTPNKEAELHLSTSGIHGEGVQCFEALQLFDVARALKEADVILCSTTTVFNEQMTVTLQSSTSIEAGSAGVNLANVMENLPTFENVPAAEVEVRCPGQAELNEEAKQDLMDIGNPSTEPRDSEAVSAGDPPNDKSQSLEDAHWLKRFDIKKPIDKPQPSVLDSKGPGHLSARKQRKKAKRKASRLHQAATTEGVSQPGNVSAASNDMVFVSLKSELQGPDIVESRVAVQQQEEERGLRVLGSKKDEKERDRKRLKTDEIFNMLLGKQVTDNFF